MPSVVEASPSGEYTSLSEGISYIDGGYQRSAGRGFSAPSRPASRRFFEQPGIFGDNTLAEITDDNGRIWYDISLSMASPIRSLWHQLEAVEETVVICTVSVGAFSSNVPTT